MTNKVQRRINWNLLAKRAYEHGRAVAYKHNGQSGYGISFDDLEEAGRKGLIAMIKFVAKELKRL